MLKNQAAAAPAAQHTGLKNVRILATSALLAAISVVLARLIIPMPNETTRFSLEAVPIFIAGMLFGPIMVGMKSRGVYETPGGTILYHAHDVLETICLDKETQHYKQQVALKFADLVYNGQWFTPLREALSAFVDKTSETVTGDVKLKLYKGNIINAGVTSPYTLYDEEVATFSEDHVYNQADATGFINLFGLPIHVKAVLDEKRGK